MTNKPFIWSGWGFCTLRVFTHYGIIKKTEIIDQTIEWLYRTGAMRAALELHL
jgi:hypothetical protein